MAFRYYDNNTGLYHVHAHEASMGVSSLDHKSISINVSGSADQGTDYPTTLTPCKLIKADARMSIRGTQGLLTFGVCPSSANTTGFGNLSVFDESGGFPIDVLAFQSSDEDCFEYRKVWKPNKYAMSGDMDMFMTIDPSGILTLEWFYSLSLYTIWKIL